MGFHTSHSSSTKAAVCFSSMWRKGGDGAGWNWWDVTGNTSPPSLHLAWLAGPITGPQLAAFCPSQRPGFQPVHIPATESWLTRDESSNLSKDASSPEKDFVDSKSPNTFINVLYIQSICTPVDITFSRSQPPQFCCFLKFSVFYQIESVGK